MHFSGPFAWIKYELALFCNLNFTEVYRNLEKDIIS
jgi:hypothetical protein